MHVRSVDNEFKNLPGVYSGWIEGKRGVTVVYFRHSGPSAGREDANWSGEGGEVSFFTNTAVDIPRTTQFQLYVPGSTCGLDMDSLL